MFVTLRAGALLRAFLSIGRLPIADTAGPSTLPNPGQSQGCNRQSNAC
jgi:hypothetical protein